MADRIQLEAALACSDGSLNLVLQRDENRQATRFRLGPDLRRRHTSQRTAGKSPQKKSPLGGDFYYFNPLITRAEYSKPACLSGQR